MAFAPVFQRPFSATFDRRAAAAAAWYLAGGAPTPVAVYQPKGAANLAASYVNLVTPGTYNAAPGVAPTLDASGWVGDGTQYLNTGVIEATDQSWSFLVRFSGVTNTGGFALAAENALFSGIQPNRIDGTLGYWHGAAYVLAAPAMTSGIAGVAGRSCYRNRVNDGTITSVTTNSAQFRIARGGGNYLAGSIQAIAIWDTSTGHATWMPAVSAAVALI